jgi:hypothetical protein
MKEMRNSYKIFVAKPEREKPVGRIGVDGRIILKCVLIKSGECVD